MRRWEGNEESKTVIESYLLVCSMHVSVVGVGLCVTFYQWLYKQSRVFPERLFYVEVRGGVIQVCKVGLVSGICMV